MTKPPCRVSIRRFSFALVWVFAAPSAWAATFDVGPGHPFATIQAAVDAAMAAAGSHTVRVFGGLHHEHVVIPDVAGRSLVLSGVGPTTIDGGGSGRPLFLDCSTGRYVISRLTLRGGRSVVGEGHGGGLAVNATGTCDVELSRLEITGNLFEDADLDPTAALGGGVGIVTREDATVAFFDSRIADNLALVRHAGAATGAGMQTTSHDSSQLVLQGLEIAGNQARGPFQAHAAGLRVEAAGRSRVRVAGLFVHDNRAEAPTTAFMGGLFSTSPDCDGCSIAVDRIRVWQNQGVPEGENQVQLMAQGSGRVALANSIVAASGSHGIAAAGHDFGIADVSNVTVADHALLGILTQTQSKGQVRIWNSIVFGNGGGIALSGGSTAGSNLVDVDPLFVDSAARDYRLRFSSPAIDAGDDAPPAGLSELDVAGLPRLQGLHVDIGAHETSAGGGGGGDGACRATAFPHQPNPFVAGTHFCRCVADRTLRAFRCGFLLFEDLVTLRIPIPPPLAKFEGEWTISPWGGIEGPFKLAPAILDKGQWVPLPVSPNGATVAAGKLVDGKEAKGRLYGFSAAKASSMRVFLSLPPTKQGPREWELEWLLPVGSEPPK